MTAPYAACEECGNDDPIVGHPLCIECLEHLSGGCREWSCPAHGAVNRARSRGPA